MALAIPRGRGREMNQEQVDELLYQALETEIGGQKGVRGRHSMRTALGAPGGVEEVPC